MVGTLVASSRTVEHIAFYCGRQHPIAFLSEGQNMMYMSLLSVLLAEAAAALVERIT